MDSSALGQFAAAVMEQVGEDFDDEATIRTVAVVAEVDTGNETQILVTCSDDRSWLELAFIKEAVRSIEMRLEAYYEGDED